MRAIEVSVEEDPVIKKKARLIDKVENSYEVPMLSQNKTVVEVNDQVPLLDMEVKKETLFVSGDGSCKNDQESEPNERKIEEVSVISAAMCNDEVMSQNKTAVEVDDQVPLVDMEVKKETLFVSGDGSCKNDQESESRKIEEVFPSETILAASSSDEVLSQNETAVEVNDQVSLLDMEVKKETLFVSGDGSCKNGKETVFNEEKMQEVSVLSAVTSSDVLSQNKTAVEVNDQVPLLDIEEKKETYGSRKNGEESESNERKIEEVLVISAATSSDEVPVVENEDSCVASGGLNPLALRKKLLVLDLNGLLADIVTPLKDVQADINIGRRAIFKRPFCDDFLKFCFDKFEVGIWSSRKQNNVVRITEFLLGDMKNKLLFCWDMSYCATTTVGSLENRHKYVVFKDLHRLWEKHDPNLPWNMGDYNATNTVLLDDSPYKALLNPPYTAIFPHSYNHQNKNDTSLGNGGDLRLHLEKLVEAENVQEFIKNNPFGQEAITEASESWEFYRETIRMLHISSQAYRFRNFIR